MPHRLLAYGYWLLGSSLLPSAAGIPFVLMNNGSGVLPDNHPLCINDGGFTGLMTGLPQADVVIAAGIRFNWVIQATKMFPDAKVVRIDIAPEEIDRNRTSEVGLVGDCGYVLDRLLPLVEGRDHSAWITRLRNAYKAFITTELEKRSTPSDPIHPVRLVAQII